MIVFFRNFFARHRSKVLTSNLILRAIFSARFPVRNVAQPIQLPDGSLRLVLQHICYLPLLVARVHSSFILPLYDFNLFIVFNMVPVLYGTYSRCQEEQLIPGQTQKYRSLAFIIENFVHRWLPFSPFPGTSLLSDQGICFLMRVFPLCWISYLMPLALMTSEEVLSRNRFECRQTGRKVFVHSPLWLFLRYFALIPFQAAAIYQFLALLMSSRWGATWLGLSKLERTSY